MEIPPTNRPITCSRSATKKLPTPLWNSRRPVSGAKKAMTMAIPPRRGMGCPWILRDERAWSSAPKR